MRELFFRMHELYQITILAATSGPYSAMVTILIQLHMYKKVHELLYRWYRDAGRHDLPWRKTDDPYKIWISEIMLQQTQVKTVLERFYFPFLEAFPTIQNLADADLDDVLKKWEGLGYYTRARNLHKAAQLAAPSLPQTVHELEALPGIGKSTAHAVAAFAYHTPVPIMDANVKRILYRFFALTKASDKQLWEYAHRLFDNERPYDYNQAMMDLGSMLCTIKTPQCDACPFKRGCMGLEQPTAYPQKKQRKATPVRRKTIVVYAHEKRVALTRRSGRFLHGLWGFDEYDCDDEVTTETLLGSIVQVYSHFRLEANVYLSTEYMQERSWFALEELETLALSGADHKVARLLRNRAVL
jgi:A/G-specific adenine glycosylase